MEDENEKKFSTNSSLNNPEASPLHTKNPGDIQKPAVPTPANSGVSLHKKQGGAALKTALFGEDEGESIKLGLWNHILKPNLKQTAFDILYSVGRAVIFQEPITGPGVSHKPISVGGYTAYQNVPMRSQQRPSSSGRPDPYRANVAGYDYRNIFVDAQIPVKDPRTGDIVGYLSGLEWANDKLQEITERFSIYEIISAQDVYETLEIGSVPFTMVDYGWTSLKGFEIVRDPERPGAYIIKIPKARRIKY